jgi:ribosomal protein S12 methylthiotransferase accessory factor
MGYERLKRMNQMWFTDSRKSTALKEYQCFDTADLYDDFQVILERLIKCGFRRVIAVDLTRKELDIPVVKMIVPGMEVYAMDEERAGTRLHRWGA